jgi:hypothetical protein
VYKAWITKYKESLNHETRFTAAAELQSVNSLLLIQIHDALTRQNTSVTELIAVTVFKAGGLRCAGVDGFMLQNTSGLFYLLRKNQRVIQMVYWATTGFKGKGNPRMIWISPAFTCGFDGLPPR